MQPFARILWTLVIIIMLHCMHAVYRYSLLLQVWHGLRLYVVSEWMNQSRCGSGCGLSWVQGTTHWVGDQIPRGKGQFWGISWPIVKYSVYPE